MRKESEGLKPVKVVISKEAKEYLKKELGNTQVPETKENPVNRSVGGKKPHSDIDCLAWVQDNAKFLSMAAIAKHIDCDRHNFTRYMKTGTLPSKYVSKLVSFVNVLLNSI